MIAGILISLSLLANAQDSSEYAPLDPSPVGAVYESKENRERIGAFCVEKALPKQPEVCTRYGVTVFPSNQAALDLSRVILTLRREQVQEWIVARRSLDLSPDLEEYASTALEADAKAQWKTAHRQTAMALLVDAGRFSEIRDLLRPLFLESTTRVIPIKMKRFEHYVEQFKNPTVFLEAAEKTVLAFSEEIRLAKLKQYDGGINFRPMLNAQIVFGDGPCREKLCVGTQVLDLNGLIGKVVQIKDEKNVVVNWVHNQEETLVPAITLAIAVNCYLARCATDTVLHKGTSVRIVSVFSSGDALVFSPTDNRQYVVSVAELSLPRYPVESIILLKASYYGIDVVRSAASQCRKTIKKNSNGVGFQCDITPSDTTPQDPASGYVKIFQLTYLCATDTEAKFEQQNPVRTGAMITISCPL
jgi:preprotein translocase subunit YajC